MQSLQYPWGRASRFHQFSSSAATEQDLCKPVIATSKVDWAKNLDCVLANVSHQKSKLETINLSGADILILARTDARDGLGLEEALERIRLFEAAGADIGQNVG